MRSAPESRQLGDVGIHMPRSLILMVSRSAIGSWCWRSRRSPWEWRWRAGSPRRTRGCCRRPAPATSSSPWATRRRRGAASGSPASPSRSRSRIRRPAPAGSWAARRRCSRPGRSACQTVGSLWPGTWGSGMEAGATSCPLSCPWRRASAGCAHPTGISHHKQDTRFQMPQENVRKMRTAIISITLLDINMIHQQMEKWTSCSLKNRICRPC